MSTRKSSLLIGVVLFVSLAANLFLAGWVFGQGGFPPRHAPKGMFFESFNRKAESLPEPQRSQVKDILDFYQPELKKQMKQVMKTREQADKLFKRNDYSREQAEESFNDMQDESLRMQQMAQEMMLDIADVLPPEQRASFLERPKEWRGRGAEFKGKKKPPEAKPPGDEPPQP